MSEHTTPRRQGSPRLPDDVDTEPDFAEEHQMTWVDEDEQPAEPESPDGHSGMDTPRPRQSRGMLLVVRVRLGA